ATTEDRVIVGVMLNKHDKQQTDKDQKKIAEIEKTVQKLEPDKEIIVYTDDAHWNQLKDLNSSLKQSNAGENVKKYIEKFLNVDAHWNQVKDLKSSLKQSNGGENVKKYIEKFLNVDVKD